MRKKFVKMLTVSAMILICGILYSCQGAGGLTVSVDETSKVQLSGSGDGAADSTGTDMSVSSQTLAETMYVHVCGAVKHSGVYMLEAGARIEQAIEAAGGFSEDADMAALNLAALAADGEKIYVPVHGETIARTDGIGSKQGGLLDINKASAQELMELPGIGEAKAGQIIAYRQANGPFESIEALKEVPGIKDGVFEPLKDLICAG